MLCSFSQLRHCVCCSSDASHISYSRQPRQHLLLPVQRQDPQHIQVHSGCSLYHIFLTSTCVRAKEAQRRHHTVASFIAHITLNIHRQCKLFWVALAALLRAENKESRLSEVYLPQLVLFLDHECIVLQCTDAFHGSACQYPRRLLHTALWPHQVSNILAVPFIPFHGAISKSLLWIQLQFTAKVLAGSVAPHLTSMTCTTLLHCSSCERFVVDRCLR